MASNNDIETARHDERIKALEKHSEECDKDRAELNTWKLTQEAANAAKSTQWQALKAIAMFWMSLAIGLVTALSWFAHFVVTNLDAIKTFLFSVFSPK